MKWKTINELPIDEYSVRKIAILSYGRGNSDRIYLSTAYWNVYCNIDGQMVGRITGTNVPTDKIIACAFEQDIIDDCLGETNTVNNDEEMKSNVEKCENSTEDINKKAGVTGWSYTYRDNGVDKPESSFIKMNSTPDGGVQYFQNGKLKHKFENIDEYREWVHKKFLGNNKKHTEITKNEIMHFPTALEVFDEMFGEKSDFGFEQFNDMRDMVNKLFSSAMEPWEWLASKNLFPQKWLKEPQEEEKKEVEEKKSEDEEKITLTRAELKQLCQDEVKKAIQSVLDSFGEKKKD